MIQVGFDVISKTETGIDDADVVSEMAIEVNPILREPDQFFDTFSILISNISSFFNGSELNTIPWLKLWPLVAVQLLDVSWMFLPQHILNLWVTSEIYKYT